ncbi:MAG: Gfo/Idh/MocA family oxidoreductase [Acidimicrobiales bacterium]
MGRISIGLVGCGAMGRRHVRAYGALERVGAGRFEISAVCDPRITAAEETANVIEQLFGKRPAVLSEHAELITSGLVEALDVVTDPSVHHLVVAPALRAGLHVICEKPLGLTVRACRAILEAGGHSAAVLAVAENYRRDGPNRLARAVLDAGMLGELHLMVEANVGGDDTVVISPWRHRRESGSIALDMGVHYTDIFAYYLGELETVFGSAFVAEPLRRMPAGSAAVAGIEEVSPGVIRATGEDSLVALYETSAHVLIQLCYLPSGPGRRWIQRSVHGRRGSMFVPPDRSGGAVVVQLGEVLLSGAELRRQLGGFELDGVAAAFFGHEGTEYDLPFAEVDAATIAIELDDFAEAVIDGRVAEVDGAAGLRAVAGVWAVSESRVVGGSVRIDDVADGHLFAAQQSVDEALGLLEKGSGHD